MSLRIYLGPDPSTDDMVSRDQAMTEPVEQSVDDGSVGGAPEVQLCLAPEQTTLAVGIDEDDTEVQLSAPRFADPDFPILLVGGVEKVLVVAGNGTTSQTWVRHYGGTAPAEHLAGVSVVCAYDYSLVKISCVDLTGTDESGWREFAPDVDGEAGTYEATYEPGGLGPDDSVLFWMRDTVAAGTAAQRKIDLTEHVAFKAIEIENPS